MKRNKQDGAEEGPTKKLIIDEKTAEPNQPKVVKKPKNTVINYKIIINSKCP